MVTTHATWTRRTSSSRLMIDPGKALDMARWLPKNSKQYVYGDLFLRCATLCNAVDIYMNPTLSRQIPNHVFPIQRFRHALALVDSIVAMIVMVMVMVMVMMMTMMRILPGKGIACCWRRA